MARPQKYKEPTVMFSKRVPKSKVDEVGKLVTDFLENIKSDNGSILIIENYVVKKGPKHKEFLIQVPVDEAEKIIKLQNKKIPEYKETYDFQNEESILNKFKCGCVIDGTLLRKQKNSPCKLTKEEHEALK